MGILSSLGIGYAELLAENWLPRAEREYAADRAFDEARRGAALRRLGSWAGWLGRGLGRTGVRDGSSGAPEGERNRAEAREPVAAAAPSAAAGELAGRRRGVGPHPEARRFVGTWDEESGYRRGIPPLPRRRKADFVRRLLSCPPETLPAPPYREGAGGLYLEGGEASLLDLELRRYFGL